MAKYKLSGSGVQDTGSKSYIPPSINNAHWRVYQEWLGEGNTPDPEFTQAELDIEAARGEIAIKDTLIRERMRKIAIDELKSEGVLPVDYKEGALK